MHIPTVDIGIRQDGRERAASVLHCGPYAEDIAECIALALSPSGQSLAKRAANPYFREDTVEVMMHAIHDFLQNPTPAKVFNDMKF